MTDKEKNLQAEAIDYYRKQIADLKKENAELRARVEKQNADILFLKHLTEELEKENAELKEKLNKIERKCKFNFVDLLHDVENESKQEEQLTKAKEIISEYSKWECEYCDYKRYPDYVTMHCSQCQKYPLHKKAEQFLKENKK